MSNSGGGLPKTRGNRDTCPNWCVVGALASAIVIGCLGTAPLPTNCPRRRMTPARGRGQHLPGGTGSVRTYATSAKPRRATRASGHPPRPRPHDLRPRIRPRPGDANRQWVTWTGGDPDWCFSSSSRRCAPSPKASRTMISDQRVTRSAHRIQRAQEQDAENVIGHRRPAEHKKQCAGPWGT